MRDESRHQALNTRRPDDISGLLLTKHSAASLLQATVSLAAAAMARVDGASITVIEDGRFLTATASSEEIRHTDEAQYHECHGPCVEATLGGQTVNADIAKSYSRWPRFAQVALDAGHRSILSTPMHLPRGGVGALNLYSRTEGRFDADAERSARAVADEVGLLVANAATYDAAELANERLTRALIARDLIGQAKGVLIASQGINSDEAFVVLRRRAEQSGRKVAEVASEVVRACQGPPGTGP